MEKYTFNRKRSSNLHSNSPQAKAHHELTIETAPEQFYEVKVCVIDGKVWIKPEKYQIGVLNTRIKGGRWEPFNWQLRRFKSVIEWLESVGAKPAEFKGSPRLPRFPEAQ